VGRAAGLDLLPRHPFHPVLQLLEFICLRDSEGDVHPGGGLSTAEATVCAGGGE